MFYIITALSGEAIPIINHFKLKKDISYTKFDLFKNDQIKLILTGTGKIKSAIATTYLLVKDNPRPEDHIINIGICGTENEDYKIGHVVLINKIDDYASRKTFYPETVFKHNFTEERLITFDKPVKKKDIINLPDCVVDMEGSGFYEAASNYFHAHRIHLLKIVSDYLRGEKLTGAFVQSLIEKNLKNINNLLTATVKTPIPDANVLTDSDYKLFDQLSNDLKLSTTQRFQILDLLKSYKVRKGEDINFLKSYIKSKKTAKADNKKIFEAIVERLEEVEDE